MMNEAFDDRDESPVEFTDSPQGDAAKEAWARRYYDNDGPEGDWDR